MFPARFSGSAHRLCNLNVCRNLAVAVSRAAVRDDRFSALTDADANHFQRVLGPSGILTSADDVAPYNMDWMGRYNGSTRIVLRPSDTSAVSEILQYCNSRRLAVVPQGGNTGLVGGSVPVFDEIVLSMAKMNRILSFDDLSGTVFTEAGTVLEILDAYVAEKGYRVPLDLGAKGSCQIGGNLATNAGGSRFIRYGSLRGNVLGVEAVLPDGSVLDTLNGVRKDNTGYDLKQLLIGSEGTLGVITKVSLTCPVKYASVNTAVVRVDCFENVLKFLRLSKQRLGEILSAFEFMDAASVNMAATELSHVSSPVQIARAGSESLVLLESAGSNANHDREKLDNLLEDAFENNVVADGVIAENQAQANALWELRESLPEAVLRAGCAGGTLKYDVSLPLSDFYHVVEDTRELLRDIADVVAWGHIGDGNLHLNVAVRDQSKIRAAREKMEPWLYEWISSKRGSISAEHGLGQMKANAICYSKSPVAIDVMRVIKRSLDPNGICNPYKVLPQ